MAQTTRVVARDGLDVRVMRTVELEVVDGPDRGLTARVTRPEWHIGTHEGNDLRLADDTVSKHHLRLTLTPDGFALEDLGSSNGTWLDGLRLGRVTIQAPVTLELGHTRLAVRPGRDEVELAAAAQTSFGPLVARSAVMRELFAQLQAVAAADAAVLLEGETGVGKELVAQSLHEQSGRAGAFVVVDCAALAGDLVESELFGHVKGAFSGAATDREGLLEAAHRGTLFLDEVGELPLPLQAKLLGALERKQVRRVGATGTRAIDVRVIAATHRELAREVNQGRFRADLFYRLAVVRLRVPPLRERREDIPLLVEHFLRALPRGEGETAPQVSAPSLARLAAQPWPGNVRELRNAVERAALFAGSDAPAPPPFVAARREFLDGFERAYLRELLAACDGNVSRAARQAGVERSYFHRLLRRLRVDTG
jgi:DNA-binding NtrC family response regulator